MKTVRPGPMAILQPSPGHSEDKPNIILIMSDDITMSLRDCKKMGRAAN